MKKGEIRVFISYAREDYDTAKRLYDDLKVAGVTPWMDQKNLLVGQNWKEGVRQGISESDYFLAVISSGAVEKKGYYQTELYKALDELKKYPPNTIYILPIRIDECVPKHEMLRDLNWADLFPSYENGLAKLLNVFETLKGIKFPLHQGDMDQAKTEIRKAATPKPESTQPEHKQEPSVQKVVKPKTEEGKTGKPESELKDVKPSPRNATPKGENKPAEPVRQGDINTGGEIRKAATPKPPDENQSRNRHSPKTTVTKGGPTDPTRFITDNGTVLDKKTGLMWAAEDNGTDINWQDAKKYCENCKCGGYDDWRMPTYDELFGLHEAGIQESGKTIIITDRVWASELKKKGISYVSEKGSISLGVSSDSSMHMVIGFIDGWDFGVQSGSDNCRVLPVRGKRKRSRLFGLF